MVRVGDAAEYLRQYIEQYRLVYSTFVSSPPQGGGYPSLVVSPYLNAPVMTCYLAKEGAAVTAPPSSPMTGGGFDIFEKEGVRILDLSLLGERFDDDRWQTMLSNPRESAELVTADGTVVRVQAYDFDWETLVRGLTLGLFNSAPELALPSEEVGFWYPYIIINTHLISKELWPSRSFRYLELLRHVDAAAWDPRTLATRVPSDIRRDFALTLATERYRSGLISLGLRGPIFDRFQDKLSVLRKSIDDLKILLQEQGDDIEDTFHTFLANNTLLIDVYGEAESKPRFNYPPGETSPAGHSYLEPDFVLTYPANRYKLVELERPNKRVGTVQGQPSAKVTQAVYQITEWKDYLLEHATELRSRFPGIRDDNCTTMLVMSTASHESLGGRRERSRYMQTISNTYAVDEVLLYEDIVERAEQAYGRLSALTP